MFTDKKMAGLLAVVVVIGAAAACSFFSPNQPPLTEPSPTRQDPTPTPSPTVIPETITPTPASTPTSPPPSPTPEISQPYAVVGVESNDVLNVREGAGVHNPITGTIPPNGINIEKTGKGVEVNGSTWFPIRYRDNRGWVNSHFLALQVGQPDPELLAVSHQVIHALAQKNTSVLADYVHPKKCLRFSPYPTLGSEDLTFCPQEIFGLFKDSNNYLWGHYDGSGKPIEMSFSEYYKEFIYDVDFTTPEKIGVNQEIGSGNAINNIHDVYPDSHYVEYHFSSIDPQYEGMDWRSLRLVFERYEQGWVLVAVVHAEWTI